MPLAELLQHEDQLSWCGAPPEGELAIGALAYDARRVQPGDAFFAWRGRVHDGHDHIEAAIAAGAQAIFAARAGAPSRVPYAVTPDPRALLTRMAQRRWRDPAAVMALVAITGTNGKTTTAHLMGSILAAEHGTAGILGTLGPGLLHAGDAAPKGSGYGAGGGLTTPEAPDLLAQLAAWHGRGVRHVALEASSIALVEGRLCATPADVGVLTNISHDHLDYHGDMAAYRAAKAQLFTDHLKPTGVAVLPLALVPLAAGASCRKLSYSAIEVPQGAAPADVQLLAARTDLHGTQLEVATPSGTLALRAPLLGTFNVENIVAATAAALALGISPQGIARGVAALACVPGRLEPVHAYGPPDAPAGPRVLVDYAHTPDAIVRLIEAARALGEGPVHLLLGCGGDRDPRKRAPMGAAAAAADVVWITSDNPRSEDPAAIAAAVRAGAEAAGMAGDGLHVELDRGRAIDAIVAAAPVDALVLIAGKGHEPYQIVGTRRLDFDDRVAARAALARRAAGAP